MVGRVSKVLLTLLLLAGCKAGGIGKSHVRLTQEYVPAVPRSSLAYATYERSPDAQVTEEPSVGREPSAIKQLSAAGSDSDVQEGPAAKPPLASVSLQ